LGKEKETFRKTQLFAFNRKEQLFAFERKEIEFKEILCITLHMLPT
jgi:hypothetical protein